MADVDTLKVACRIAEDWVDALGNAYKRNGSSPWKPLPTYPQFSEAVLAIAATLSPPRSLADYERDGTRYTREEGFLLDPQGQ